MAELEAGNRPQLRHQLIRAAATRVQVINPVAALRPVASLSDRLRAAVYAATHGPVISDHQTSQAVLWDQTQYSGKEVAGESAELLSDVLAVLMEALSPDQLEQLNSRSMARRSAALYANCAPGPIKADQFIQRHSKFVQCAETGTVIMQYPGLQLDFNYCPVTGKLLAVRVPFNSTQVQFMGGVGDQIAVQRADANSLSLTGQLRHSLKTMLLTSIADLEVLQNQPELVAEYFKKYGAANG